MWRQRKMVTISNPGRGLHQEPNLPEPWSWTSWSPEPSNKCLLFKPPSLRYFAIGTPEVTKTNLKLGTSQTEFIIYLRPISVCFPFRILYVFTCPPPLSIVFKVEIHSPFNQSPCLSIIDLIYMLPTIPLLTISTAIMTTHGEIKTVLCNSLCYKLSFDEAIISIRFTKWKSLSSVWLCATPWAIQSMEFSRPEYWSG